MPALYELGAEFRRVYDQAFEESTEDGAIDSRFVEELAALDMAFDTKAENCAGLVRSWDSDIAALKAEEDRLAAARKRLEKRVANLKAYMLGEMKALGKDKIKGRVLSIRVQANSQPSLVLADESKVPREYMVQTWSLDRRAVVAAIKQGTEIEGASLEYGSHIRIGE